jgi:hypothetical protein
VVRAHPTVPPAKSKSPHSMSQPAVAFPRQAEGAGQILFPMLSRLLVLVTGQRNGPAVFSCAT